eukprot:6468950-Prymnesium_polylepis.1
MPISSPSPPSVGRSLGRSTWPIHTLLTSCFPFLVCGWEACTAHAAQSRRADRDVRRRACRFPSHWTMSN